MVSQPKEGLINHGLCEIVKSITESKEIHQFMQGMQQSMENYTSENTWLLLHFMCSNEEIAR